MALNLEEKASTSLIDYGPKVYSEKGIHMILEAQRIHQPRLEMKRLHELSLTE